MLHPFCRLAAEVERLQPLAERSAELETRIEAYKEELATVTSAHSAASAEEVRQDALLSKFKGLIDYGNAGNMAVC